MYRSNGCKGLVRALALGLLSLLAGCGKRSATSDGPFTLDGPDAGIWFKDGPVPDRPLPDGHAGDTYVPPDLSTADGSVTKNYLFPANLKKKVDILFVVDNSNSMAEEQQGLAKTFPQFVDMLAMMSGGMPDVHIGVVSSNLGAGNYNLPSCTAAGGDKGKLHNAPRKGNCIPPNDGYISYKAGVTNVPGTGTGLAKVKSAFSCIAEIGTGGCGFEYTIESSRRALAPVLNTNPGFMRKDAMLVVIYVTDEDDCSAQKPQLFDPTQSSINDPLGPLTSFRCFEFGIQCTCPGGSTCKRTTVGPRTNCKPAYNWLFKIPDYITFFKNLKPPGQVVMAALAGPSTPVVVKMDNQYPALQFSCQLLPDYRAVPAIRIKALLNGFGTASYFHTICSGNYGPPLKKLGTLITAQLGGACLQPLTDTSPSVPGLQASCKVSDVIGAQVKPVPPCKSQSGACNPCPCWRVKPDAKCAALSGYSLKVARSAPAPSGTIVKAQCLGPK